MRLELIPPSQINSFVYHILRKDCNASGGGLLFYVNQDLSCKVLNKYPMVQDLEMLVLEFKLSKTN